MQNGSSDVDKALDWESETNGSPSATNVLCDFQETFSPLWASLGSP